MTVTVTMLQTRLGEDGALWTINSSHPASDAFAQFLIGSNLARGIGPQVPQSGLSSADQVALKSLASGAWMKIARWVLWGDSWAGQSMSISSAPSSYTVSDGVMTILFTSHGLYSGAKCSVTGAALDACNLIQAAVTRIDANSFSLPAPGAPDGAVTVGPAALQVVMYDRKTANGTLTHLQRLSVGAITCPNVAGFPGYSVAAVLAEFARSVAPYSPDVVLVQDGYNSISAGVSEDGIVADKVAQMDAIIGIGAVALMQSVGPWSSGAAANSSANRIKAQSVNRRLAAACETRPMARFLDVAAIATDTSTGLAKTGWMQADSIHPAAIMHHHTAVLALAAAPTVKPRKFVSSIDDNRTGNAASLNIARYMPHSSVGGGVATSGNINVAWTSGGTVAVGMLIVGASGSANVYYVSAITTGILGAVAPTHTSGSVVDGGATLEWVATSLAVYTTVATGIALNWTVAHSGITTNHGAGWVAVAPDGVGYASVGRWYATGASQTGRMSFSFTTADFTPGETVDVYCKFRLSTQHAPSGELTPAGQNITSIQAQMAFTVDGATYTPGDWRTNVLTTEMIDEDYVEAAIVIENCVVPPGESITLARLDLNTVFGGVGTAQVWMWRAECRKRS